MVSRTSFLFPLILLCAVVVAVPSQCQDNAYESGTHTVQGQITSLDWVKGVIVVRWLQSEPTIAYDEVVLQVPRDIEIMKGTDTVGFDDVNQFDQVTVKYRKSQSTGLPKVVSMTIDNPV